MRYAFAAGLLLVVLTGCVSDSEDRAFFNAGWIRPEQGANVRLDTR